MDPKFKQSAINGSSSNAANPASRRLSQMDAFLQLPVELQIAIVRHLPFQNQLRLRLVNHRWNDISIQALDLILAWRHSSGLLLPIDSVSASGSLDDVWERGMRIPVVEDLRQSQLVSRVYKVLLTCAFDNDGLAKIRALDSCFQEAVQRPLELEWNVSWTPGPHGEFEQATLAQQCPRFRLVRTELFCQPSAGSTNYVLGQSSHLQQIDTQADNLASLQLVPRQWNSTLTTLGLSTREPANGTTCIRMMANSMRNLRKLSLYIEEDIPDNGFFQPLVNLQQLRELEILGVGHGYHCEFPMFPAPGLTKLHTLELRTVRLARDRHLFMQLPWLESLKLQLESDDTTKESLEDESREVMDVFIDNCLAGSLPNLKILKLQPFAGCYDPEADEGLLNDDSDEIWEQAPTLDFDIARIFSATSKCPKLELLTLSCYVLGVLSADVLLISLEQCPTDYLLASPRAIQVEHFLLEHFLEEPQLLLDYAIGMVRTGLQRLELVVRVSGNRRTRLAKRRQTQELVANTIRLLAVDLPQLSAADIRQESVDVQEWNWSEAIVIFEAHSGRRHELKLHYDLGDD